MENITLEQVDIVRERCNVSYAKAKEALEISNGDVLEAIIYLEQNQKEENENYYTNNKCFSNTISIEDLKSFIKDLIEKGNVARIKIKKDDKELLDIPVNAGIAASVIAITIPPILATVIIAAIATQITIEVTMEDGSVEVINKYVTQVANDVKNKAVDLADIVKNKVNDVKTEVKTSKDEDGKTFTGGETIYTYTVDFEEEKKNNSDEN